MSQNTEGRLRDMEEVKRMKSKMCIVSVFLAFAVFAALVSGAHASSFFNTQTGTYTEVTAAVAGT